MKESGTALRQLIRTTSGIVRSLQALGSPTDEWDHILVHIVSERLDPESHKQWETTLGHDEMPTYGELVEFLEKRSRLMQVLEPVVDSEPLTVVPEPDRTQILINRLTRWKLLVSLESRIYFNATTTAEVAKI